MRAWLLAALLPLAACSIQDGDGDGDTKGKEVAASGTGGTQTYKVADFTEVALRGPDDVTVTVGPAFSVSATGPQSVLQRLRIARDGDTLLIGRKRDDVLIHADTGSAKVTVTLPRLAQATLTGSGDLRVDKAAGAFNGRVVGTGTMTLAGLAATDADLAIQGTGDIKADGTAKTVKVSIAGTGDLEAKGLSTTSADVSIAGTGGATLTANGPAKVSILGSGDVDLGPKARCTVSKMGTGDVQCGS